MNTLVIIPARGGSKGIPRKNVRLLNGKPLISYVINNALSSKYVTDVYVSTDDEEIENVAHKYGCHVIKRNPELGKDKVTLDPVIHDATCRIEEEQEKKYDLVITMQPTSPLLKKETLDAAIQYFLDNNCDTLISVVNKPHLSWKNEDGKIIPNYEKRLNRQELPANYLETGAFVITKREFVKEHTRFGTMINVYEVSEEESIDIDSYGDWALCESFLKRKKIVLRCDGYKMLGMGHIYHCLTLAYHLTGHDIVFVLNKKHKEGIKKIEEAFFKYELIEDDADFYRLLNQIRPNIIVNDCLDTTEAYIRNLKKYADKVVTIEDMGSGSVIADVCINALYEKNDNPNIYCGEKYVCLREEFLIANPKIIKKEVQNVLVLFGGTDPCNLTRKLYHIAKRKYENLNFTFITGIGYDPETLGIISDTSKNIRVLNNVKNVSQYMEASDIAFTSQGRTVYELAAIGVPSIVLAQNKRELLHTFAAAENGFMNLGLGENVTEEEIENALDLLIADFEKRKEMNRRMLKKNIKMGITREINLILE